MQLTEDKGQTEREIVTAEMGTIEDYALPADDQGGPTELIRVGGTEFKGAQLADNSLLDCWE